MNPILALVGSVVVIDAVSPKTISEVLRQHKVETALGLLWLAVHLFWSEAP